MSKFVVFAAIILQCYAQELIVELPNGKVQGTTLTSPNGKNFYTWRHIPYAKPPVGDLRFQPPVRPDPWTEVLDGSADSKACLFVGTYEGDPVPTNGNGEDCLYVNVYSPVEPNSSLRLPVMFWIYGGGYITGTGDFSFTDPTPFMEENVIIVTFNYRLSIFGFLSTNDKVLPGNSALKDQLAALIWTRENIAWFGGNPLDITLFGESAGAFSVGYHLVSPMSRNLFTGAIMQSGTCLVSFSTQVDPRADALRLAKAVDSSVTDSSSSQDILKALQAADVDLLINTTLAQGTTFGPVLEVDNDTPFVSRPSYELIEAGNITRVPIIIGTNSEEELVTITDVDTALQRAEWYDANPSLLLPAIHLKDGVSVDTVIREIKQAYVGNGTFVENLGTFIGYLSDNVFVRPAIKHAVLQSKFTPVYFYEFSFNGTQSINHPNIPGAGRVAHAEDVGYLFNISTKPIETDADYLTRRRFVKLWTNFAKTKNPTPDDDSAELLQHVKWEPLDETNLQYMDIGENLELKYNRKANKTAFWNYLWETYSYRPYNTF